MTATGQPQAKRRQDYQPSPYLISEVDLRFELDPLHCRVTSRLSIERNGQHDQPLVLDGEGLTLVSVALDEQPLDSSRYACTASQLQIATDRDQFTLTLVTEIAPQDNTALEGLYLSDGAYCTQCEAEGFRRITYFLDRPDIMARYRTTIIADAKIPYLLSNGNKIDGGQLTDGRHFATWQDPFPKPCYLFALVAGDFDCLSDQFETQSGKQVALELYVEKGQRAKGTFALESLKRAMAWDEQRFGLEYDLDIYMVVAVDFFNMGAMENKGLNIFNTKYVLGLPDTATDADFHNIESVIGHEYFHNWTGNRVTCRDWFQLSLKEGLTVFRDQLFSADMGSAAVNRIRDVQVIQTHQFAEDAGPMAHPIRPEQVIEMNNFYTVTVYNKGAEVIRMLHTLLGESGFQRGMRRYFELHDGQAATCEDFVAAMESANSCDLAQFRRWYEQSGTPTVTVSSDYDAENQLFTLAFNQHTPVTADQTNKQPQVIPIAYSAFDPHGRAMDLYSNEVDGDLIILVKETQRVTFTGVKEKPALSLLEGFSAPVKLVYPQSDAELAIVAKHAERGYSRWQAIQQMASRLLLSEDAITQTSADALCEVLQHNLLEPLDDRAIVAELLTLPSAGALIEIVSQADMLVLQQRIDALYQLLGTQLQQPLQACLQTLPSEPYRYDAGQAATRSLRLALLNLLAAADPTLPAVAALFQSADNMTDSYGALQIAVRWRSSGYSELLEHFKQRWLDDPLTTDKWLGLVASVPDESVFAGIQAATGHPLFSMANPNRVRALYGAFAQRNVAQFHRADGLGYQQLAEVVIALNATNPQTAARLVTPLTQLAKHPEFRQQQLRQQLQRIMATEALSNDLYEIVSKALN